jgi:hypothetical protein
VFPVRYGLDSHICLVFERNCVFKMLIMINMEALMSIPLPFNFTSRDFDNCNIRVNSCMGIWRLFLIRGEVNLTLIN